MAGWVMHQVQDPPPLGSSWAHLAPPTQRSLSTERVMPGVKESQAWVTGVQNPCRSVGLWCHPHTSSLQVLSPAAIALGWQVGTLPLRVAKQGDRADLGDAGNQWGTPMHPQHPDGSSVLACFAGSARTESEALCLRETVAATR